MVGKEGIGAATSWEELEEGFFMSIDDEWPWARSSA